MNARTLTLIWAATMLVLGSNAGISVLTLILLMWGGGALLVGWLVRFAFHIYRSGQEQARPKFFAFGAEGLLILLCAAAVWLGTAFDIRFELSRPALERYVASVRSSVGHNVNSTRRVGLFWIRETELVEKDIVRLITTECMFDDCGIVYSPDRRPPVIGEDFYSPLASGWWHWWRSW
jgi:hypothetical protein